MSQYVCGIQCPERLFPQHGAAAQPSVFQLPLLPAAGEAPGAPQDTPTQLTGGGARGGGRVWYMRAMNGASLLVVIVHVLSNCI